MTGYWTSRNRKLAFILMVCVAAFPLTVAIAWLRVVVDGNAPSRVVGTVAHGGIEHAHAVPPWGPGYVTYSVLGSAVGRQYVDGRVRDTLLASFSGRSRAEGGRRFVMGETGWPSGGRFRAAPLAPERHGGGRVHAGPDQERRGGYPGDLALEQVRVRAGVRRAGRDGRPPHPVRERGRLPAGGRCPGPSARAPHREGHHRAGVRAAAVGDAIKPPARRVVEPPHSQTDLGSARRALPHRLRGGGVMVRKAPSMTALARACARRWCG